MVPDEVACPGEPEPGQPGQDTSLVGDLGGKDDVERRDAVARDQQQALVVEGVQLADLAASDVQGFRHAWVPPSVRDG